MRPLSTCRAIAAAGRAVKGQLVRLARPSANVSEPILSAWDELNLFRENPSMELHIGDGFRKQLNAAPKATAR